MKHVLRELLTLFFLTLACPLVANAGQFDGPFYDAPPISSSFPEGIDIEDNIAFDCNTCPCLIYQEAETTDAVGCGIDMHAGNAFGTSRAGGDLVLSGGLGSHSIACNASIAAGDTVTTTVNSSALAALTEGVDFDCSGTNDACCASLCAAIDAQAGVSCSGTVTPINPTGDVGTHQLSFAIADGGVDGAFAADTSGVNGAIVIYPGTGSNPPIASVKDYRDGIRLDNNSVRISFDGSDYYAFGTSGVGFGNNVIGVAGYMTSTATPFVFGASSISNPHGLGANDFGFAYDIAIIGTAYFDGPVVQATTKGATYSRPAPSVQTVTFAANPGDASKTTSGLCPANAVIDGVTWRVVTTGTNCASVEIGDGTDVDMFATAFTLTQGDTGDISDYTATTRVNAYDATGFEATVTANGGNCYDLAIRFTCFYSQLTADTTN